MKHTSPTVSKAHGQRGIALVFVLIMLSIATSIAVISARNTLSAERSARNDRDRQVAFQSAELALNDAQLDIFDPASERGCRIGGIVLTPAEMCGKDDEHRGFCLVPDTLENTPIYRAIDWEETSDTQRPYVNYGEKTNRIGQMQTGTNGTPAAPPKYIIVRNGIAATFRVNNAPITVPHAYRVYALGYGISRETQVLLEAVMIKPKLSRACPNESGL